ncbi:sodium:solute symporter family transporter [Mucisphaera calidilacus]|uniref:Sodium/glucose cotransporter n=1 Tax=Mucisphaera calidilacus TaxID=2527982 RepID=A0A518BWT8_9BACT|nr:sodium:solute symporter [Mucisphaera calidilacus]QDU71442.1 Sodium/glucose cotransporter [Mucisphaera calidilacus]
MEYLSTLDYAIIAVYFTVLLSFGYYLKNKAAKSLEDYFLGGRSIPWWAMGMSGMASWLDMTGTMIIVSFLYMLGPRGLYIEFRGGAVLILAFMLLWTGKWHRRSNCMTGAEWNIYRFGSGPGGQFTRVMAAITCIVATVGMLGYMVKGVGLFLAMFLPFSPSTCAIGMLGVATIYTMASGFYGVVFTDIFQSFIILFAVIAVTFIAVATQLGYEGDIATLAHEVTGSTQWTTTSLQWHTTMPSGYEAYEHLTMFALFYLIRNIMAGIASGGDPKYFGARNERECGLLSFLWGWLIMFRWPMMMGFAVLGLFMVKDAFPDQSVLATAADLIRQTLGEVPKSRWEDAVAGIINAPQLYPELVTNLQTLLGEDWATKLKLLSYEGTVNPERILPAVLMTMIPQGLKGLLLVALIAASMSTFDSTVNGATAYWTRDIYQAYLRPNAGNKELIYASYIFGVVLVAGGFAMGYSTTSINHIWDWIIMGLGSGLAIPGILRLYWWRFNAGGVVVGTVAGLTAAIVQRIYFPEWTAVQQFTILTTISLLSTIIGTLLTKPTDTAVLANFYKTTRPFGLWGPFKTLLPEDERRAMEKEHRNDIIAVPFVMTWQISLFMLPMQLVIGAYRDFLITLPIFLIGLTGMYWFWYRHLPPREPATPNEATNQTTLP